MGARFRGSRVTTELTISCRPNVPVLVIDTETRHLPAKQAAAVVHKVATTAAQFHPWLIYKKTDSTLRGNIAAEFRALLDALPGRSLLYAPAYPEMGRTVRDGHLFVHGTPVHQTSFAEDPLNPVHSSEIRKMMADIPVTVLDGESPSDLAAAANKVIQQDPTPIASGPASFAGAIAASLFSDGGTLPPFPRLSRCLVVNGSMHPMAAAQIEFAHLHRFFESEWVHFDANQIGSGLEAVGLHRAAVVGERIRQILTTSQFNAMIIFGGDTAFGIHRALGSPDFHPHDELVPGVPLSRCGDLFWITKAGGFGEVGILGDIRMRLQ